MYRCSECGCFNQIPSEPHEGIPACANCRTPLDVSGAPQEVGADSYTEVLLSSPMPVVVDFWASWAPPCHLAEPIVETFARRHAGRVLVLKVNSDKSPALLAALGINAVPTFQAIEQGMELARHGGVLPQDAFERWADRAFTHPSA